MKIYVKLEPGAYLPTRAYETDAGWDLYATKDFTVPAGGGASCDTGVHIAIPDGCCGLLVSKSGLNVKHGLTSTGLIDATYSGSIVVKLYNHDKGRDYSFKAGEKISQIVILPLPVVEGLEVVRDLEERGRGNRGFGSSGL